MGYIVQFLAYGHLILLPVLYAVCAWDAMKKGDK